MDQSQKRLGEVWPCLLHTILKMGLLILSKSKNCSSIEEFEKDTLWNTVVLLQQNHIFLFKNIFSLSAFRNFNE